MSEKILKNNIIFLRKNHGYTQMELSKILNYSDKVISKWETGESIPDITALKKIAKLYAIKLDELLYSDFFITKDNNMVVDSKELKFIWKKNSTFLFKASLIIVVSFYILSAFFSGWFGNDWFMYSTFFIYVLGSFFVMGYTIIQQLIVHNVVAEAVYKEHKIIVKSTICNSYLYIDCILVEKYSTVFQTSFKLTGKIGEENIKVNVCRFYTTKFNIFIE